jgi:hypothetical protein
MNIRSVNSTIPAISTGSTSQPEVHGGRRIKGIRLIFLVMMLAGQLAVSPAQNPARMQTAYTRELVRVIEYRDSLKDVHPFISYLYPIAIAKDGHFYVFDLDATGKQYFLAASEKTGMEVPQGVRAAFPLHFYDNRCACVVSADVFDSPKGYITIFHEFIHCHQYHTVEQALRQKLPLAVKSQEKQDYMWEINYSFPYHDGWFKSTYEALLTAAAHNDLPEVKRLRKELAELLNDEDYQYMVWQEWKEGFALYIENKLRGHLGIEQNQVGKDIPGSRLVFYAGGAALIEVLVQQNPALSEDLEGLFHSIYNI